MDSDRVRLARIDENLKSLVHMYNRDIPHLKTMVDHHEDKITKLERDRKWLLSIIGGIWAATIAFFTGFWEKLK